MFTPGPLVPTGNFQLLAYQFTGLEQSGSWSGNGRRRNENKIVPNHRTQPGILLPAIQLAVAFSFSTAGKNGIGVRLQNNLCADSRHQTWHVTKHINSAAQLQNLAN